MEKRGWAYRRRQPEGTVLYEAVRDNLTTLLAEANEVGRGLPRYVERDFARYLECGVLAHGVTAPSGLRCIKEHLGLPTRPAKRAPAQGPPQSAWC